MKSPEKDLTGTLPSAENGSTGLHFGVSHYRGTSIKRPPTTFHTVSLRASVKNSRRASVYDGGGGSDAASGSVSVQVTLALPETHGIRLGFWQAEQALFAIVEV